MIRGIIPQVVFIVLFLGLLGSLFVGIPPVKAANGPPYVDFVVTNGPPLEGSPPYTVTISVGQTVEFAALPLFGVPPYTYQWSTEVWKSNPLDMMFTSSIDVSGATFQKFEYNEITTGSYEICVEINDSTGNTLSASGPIVIVQPLNSTPSNSPSPSPIPSPNPSSSPTLPPSPSAKATPPNNMSIPTQSVATIPTATIAAAISGSVAAVIVAGLLLYHKRKNVQKKLS